MKVAVTGATGFAGGHTLRALVDAGHEPRALVRSASKLERVRAIHELADVDHVLGDVTEVADVATLLDGCDAVIHTAAVAHIGRRHRRLIEATNAPAAANVLHEAIRRGLDPIVHVSSTSALHPPPGGVYRRDSPVTSQPVGAYAASKAESERLARRLQDEGHPVVIVWPSGITGPDDAGLSVSAEGTARLLRSNTVPLPHSGGTLMHDVRDLAKVLARLMEPGAGPRRFGVFGHYLAWGDLEPFLSALTGRTLRTRRLPDAVFLSLGRIGDALSSLRIPAPIDHAAARFMTSLVPGDDEHTRTELGVQWRPPEETFADWLRWMIRNGHLDASKAPALG